MLLISKHPHPPHDSNVVCVAGCVGHQDPASARAGRGIHHIFIDASNICIGAQTVPTPQGGSTRDTVSCLLLLLLLPPQPCPDLASNALLFGGPGARVAAPPVLCLDKASPFSFGIEWTSVCPSPDLSCPFRFPVCRACVSTPCICVRFWSATARTSVRGWSWGHPTRGPSESTPHALTDCREVL